MSNPRVTGDWIDTYCQSVQNTEPPDLYHKWVAVSVIASALKRKCWFELGTLTVYPNFYIVLVGPPGIRKGTALGFGLDLLRRTGINVASDAGSRQALITKLKESLSQEPPVNGVVIFHSSLTVLSKELAVFLGFNNLDLMSNLCDWFDCGPEWSYDTQTRGKETVTAPWVNLLAAITPQQIQSTMPRETVGSGLASRIVFVYEDYCKFVPYPFQTPDEIKAFDALGIDLDAVHAMRGPFQMSGTWLNNYVDFRKELHDNPSLTDPNFEYYISRKPVHVLKLCMVMSASRGDTMIITEDDLHRAVSLLEETEKKMPRTFAGFGRASTAPLTNQVVEFLIKRGRVTENELMTSLLGNFTNSQELLGVADTLRRTGLISMGTNSKGQDIFIVDKTHPLYYQYTANGQFPAAASSRPPATAGPGASAGPSSPGQSASPAPPQGHPSQSASHSAPPSPSGKARP